MMMMKQALKITFLFSLFSSRHLKISAERRIFFRFFSNRAVKIAKREKISFIFFFTFTVLVISFNTFTMSTKQPRIVCRLMRYILLSKVCATTREMVMEMPSNMFIRDSQANCDTIIKFYVHLFTLKTGAKRNYILRDYCNMNTFCSVIARRCFCLPQRMLVKICPRSFQLHWKIVATKKKFLHLHLPLDAHCSPKKRQKT